MNELILEWISVHTILHWIISALGLLFAIQWIIQVRWNKLQTGINRTNIELHKLNKDYHKTQNEINQCYWSKRK